MENKYYDIIKAPIVTEKNTKIAQEGKYGFKVDFKANKTQIKQAVEALFKVKVAGVNIVNPKPKKKRVGRYSGTTKRYKKAVVTLAEGSTIDLS
ncbi:MAG: 50S ribosomal protein L23 [Bacilli bacterium]|jgi:large subunit ribosomal protein L23|nr:50S ribosomal protein L23 [Bacilli bacterium]